MSERFGARSYASSLGRFLTLDWSKNPEGVPYADYANPQSLNLYSYVLNNPATATDPDGHWCFLGLFGSTCGQGNANSSDKEGTLNTTSRTPKKSLAAVAAGEATADLVSDISVSISAAAAGLAAVVALTVGQNGGDPEMVAREKEDGAKAAAAKGESVPEADRSGAQDRRLTSGEIQRLEGAGHDVHELKNGYGGGASDLYKDPQGNVYVKPKDFPGRGEPVGVNLNDLR